MNILETRVLELIGESTSSPDVFADTTAGMAQITDSLNDAIQEICMVTGSHRRKWRVAVESGKNFYQITSDRDYFAWPVSIFLTVQKRRLEQVDLPWLLGYNYRWLYDRGFPERYFLIGHDKFGIHPRPSGSSYTLEIDAVAIPEAYSFRASTDNIERIKLRTNFQWAAVHFAVSEFWATRGDARTATKHFYEYLKRLGVVDMYPESHERHWELRHDVERPKNEN
jgi:hypothetical protein